MQALTRGLTSALLTLLLLGLDSSQGHEQAALALRCGVRMHQHDSQVAACICTRKAGVKLACSVAQRAAASNLAMAAVHPMCRRCGAGDLLQETAQLAQQLAAVAAVSEAVCAQWYCSLASDLL